MPIVYSLIARGETVICEATHPLHSGNFRQVSLKLLHKVHTQQKQLNAGGTAVSSSSSSSTSSPARPSSYSKQTLLFNGHTFNFCFTDGIYCLAMCDASMRHSTPFLFLTDVLNTFLRVSNEGKSAIEGPSLKALTEVLQNRMESYSDEAFIAQHQSSMDKGGGEGATAGGAGEGGAAASSSSQYPSGSSSSVASTLPLTQSSSKSHPPSSSSSSSSAPSSSSSSSGAGADADDGGERGGLVSDVRRELDGVKEKLMDNLAGVMSRGEALESLVDRSSALHDSSDQFRQASTRLTAQLRWQQMRSAVTILTMTAICVYILAATKCGVTLDQC